MGFFKNFLKRKDIFNAGWQTLCPADAGGNMPSISQMADSYRKWVYTCVDKNASAIASVDYKLVATTGGNEKAVALMAVKREKNEFRHDKSFSSSRRFKAAQTVEEIIDHPFLHLLENPSSLQPSQYSLWYSIAFNLELFGTSYIEVKKDSVLGIPVSLNVLHTNMVKPVKDANGTLQYFEYATSGKSKRRIEIEEMCVIGYYNPMSDIYGFSPLMACYDQYLLDQSFDTYQLSLNKNSGNPSVIIKYTGKSFKEDDRERLEAGWNKTMRGLHNTGKAKVIGNDFDIVKLGLSPKELDFLIGRRVTKEAILSCYGVPLPFIDAKDTNRASFDTAVYQYQKYTIAPKVRQIVDAVNSCIVDMYNEPRIYLSYDNPVEGDRIAIIDETIKLLSADIIDREEARMRVLS